VSLRLKMASTTNEESVLGPVLWPRKFEGRGASLWAGSCGQELEAEIEQRFGREVVQTGYELDFEAGISTLVEGKYNLSGYMKPSAHVDRALCCLNYPVGVSMADRIGRLGLPLENVCGRHSITVIATHKKFYTPFHVDPLGQMAWAVLIRGRKLWHFWSLHKESTKEIVVSNVDSFPSPDLSIEIKAGDLIIVPSG
jgi:hypothetical protein